MFSEVVLKNVGLPLLLQGFFMTIKLWLGAALLSGGLGITLGVLSSDRISGLFIRRIITLYVFVVRGIPVYVQVLMVYFVLPELLGINFSAFTAAILALGICSSGYVAEIVRSGFNAIGSGHWGACFVLGYTRWQAVWYVILPGVVRIIIPALANEQESLMKSTAILSSIGLLELTRAGSNIVAQYMNPVSTYSIVACCYLGISFTFILLIKSLERRLAQ